MKNIKRRFTNYMIISYLVVFLFPLIICLSLYGRHTTQLQRNIESSNQAIVDNIAQNINNLFSDLENELTSLSLQTTRIQKLPVSEGVGNPLNFNQIHTQLFLKSLSNPLLDTGYIILFDEQKVITPFVAGNPLVSFYDSYFQYDELSLEEFLQEFTMHYYDRSLLPYTLLKRNGSQSECMLVVHSVPNLSYRHFDGVIIFVLDFSYIEELMRNSLAQDSSIILTCMIDEEDYMISMQYNGDVASVNLDQLTNGSVSPVSASLLELPGEKYYISRQSVENHGINVIMLQSSHTAFSTLNSFKLVIVLQMLFIGLITAMVIYYNTKRNLNSVQTIMDTFASVTLNEDEMKDVFAYIQNAASKTISQNQMLQTYIDKQQGVMVDAFLRRLINGDYLYETDIMSDLDELHISYDYNYFLAVLCTIRIPREDGFTMKSSLANQTKEQLKKALIKEFPENLYLIDYDVSSLVLLFGTNMDKDSLKKQIDSFYSNIRLSYPTVFCSGSFVSSISEVPRTYREARYVHNSTGYCIDKVQWYHEVYNDNVIFIYQNNYITEQNLLNQILAGNTAKVEQQMDEMYRECLLPEYPSPKALRCLSYNLYRLVGYLLTMQENENELTVELNQRLDAAMLDSNQFQEFIDYVRQLCISISQEKQIEKLNRSDVFLKKIMKYIQMNYSDPQLCVSSIAAYCNLSPNYLSQFFKEQKNENISTFIERIRIDKSCEYLKGTTSSINEIAEKVGYTNSHTFRTAFKRSMAVTPKEYREKM